LFKAASPFRIIEDGSSDFYLNENHEQKDYADRYELGVSQYHENQEQDRNAANQKDYSNFIPYENNLLEIIS